MANRQKQNPHNDVRIPWLGLPSGKDGKPHPLVVLRRLLTVALLLLCPLGVVLAGLVAFVLTRRAAMDRRIDRWVIPLGVLVAPVGVAAVGGLSTYLAAWADLARVFDLGTSTWFAPLAEEAADRWPQWIRQQAPASVGVALILGGAVAWRRRLYDPNKWRASQQEAGAEWDKLSDRQATKGHRRLERERPSLVTATTPFDQLSFRLGINDDGRPVRLTGEEMRSHIISVTPSGFGKTAGMFRVGEGWIVDCKARQLPMGLLDMKGDPEVRDGFIAMCQHAGRRCRVVTLTDPKSETYNALKNGNAEEAAALVMEVQSQAEDGGFSEPHHRSVGENYLILAMEILDSFIAQGLERREGDPWVRDLDHLASLMKPRDLARLTRDLPEGSDLRARAAERQADFEDDPSLGKSVLGMAERISLMVNRGARHILRADPDGIDLEASIRAGEVVIFSLNSGVNPSAAQTVANLAVKDLVRIFGTLDETKWAKRNDVRCLVMLDEFSALKGTLLEDFFARCRSQGGSVYLTTQIEADLDEVSPTFKAKCFSNSNVWFLGHQEGDDAESRSKALGTRKTIQETRQVAEDTDAIGSLAMGSGVGSLRMVDEFAVHPNELRRLRPGQVFKRVIEPPSMERVRITQTRPWDTLRAVEEDDSPTEQPAAAAADPPEPETEGDRPREDSAPAAAAGSGFDGVPDYDDY